jgi:predicted acetyltransferase
MVGFAMICPYSNIGQNPDFTMAEFTIFPSFRKKHLALESVKKILERHPGKWEIRELRDWLKETGVAFQDRSL